VKKWPVGSDEDIRFLALALGGEVGELQNLIKKIWRGDFTLHERWTEIAGEMADVRVYLELFARACGYDLDGCVRAQALPKIRRRWPPPESEGS